MDTVMAAMEDTVRAIQAGNPDPAAAILRCTASSPGNIALV
jgi:hypothetical protein